MRLLNTQTRKLEWFANSQSIPKYAALSHRWLDVGEVLYGDMSLPDEHLSRLAGYPKLVRCCQTAHRFGMKYVWIDTCCIDKGSSSELSEAINSMFEWYKRSAFCFAYLQDVSCDKPYEEFMGSEWFKRGWTLQELIAPKDVIFFSSDWAMIGTKISLAPFISDITQIDEEVLLTGRLDRTSIAKKMSWAAHRTTTREEDEAYSLMGIFGVNMPTIYGEGRKAFFRLQEEIMKVSNDRSIFAWCSRETSTNSVSRRANTVTVNTKASYELWKKQRTRPFPSIWNNELTFTGLLATSPAGFAGSGDIIYSPWGGSGAPISSHDYSTTNNGIRIRLPLHLISKPDNIFLAYLFCEGTLPDRAHIAIFLQLLEGGRYSRIAPTRLIRVNPVDLDTPFPTFGDWLYIAARTFTMGEIATLGRRWDGYSEWHSNVHKASKRYISQQINVQSVLDFCTESGFDEPRYAPSGAWSRDNSSAEGSRHVVMLSLRSLPIDAGIFLRHATTGDRLLVVLRAEHADELEADPWVKFGVSIVPFPTNKAHCCEDSNASDSSLAEQEQVDHIKRSLQSECDENSDGQPPPVAPSIFSQFADNAYFVYCAIPMDPRPPLSQYAVAELSEGRKLKAIVLFDNTNTCNLFLHMDQDPAS